MRTSLRFATAVASLLCILFGVQVGMAQGTSQPGAARGYGNDVVVIDIGQVFRNHVRFKQLMDDLKADLEQVEMSFRQQSDQITKMAEGLKKFHPGSPEYNRLEEEITRARSKLQTDMALKKKEFMLKEAGIYSQVYAEIVGVVARYCERHGVSLALRFGSEEIDPQNPQSVMKGINRNVVYQQNRNITYDVLAELNPRTPPPDPRQTQDSRNFRPPR